MCTSVTGALTIIGVSTSISPRSTKKWRACMRIDERCASISRVAVGFHSLTMAAPAAHPGQCLPHADAGAGLYLGQPVNQVRRQDENHCRTHVETTHFSPFFQA